MMPQVKSNAFSMVASYLFKMKRPVSSYIVLYCFTTIECLQVMEYIQSEAVRSAYQRLKINSFVEGNRLLKWCPGLDCGKALKVEVLVLYFLWQVSVLWMVASLKNCSYCLACSIVFCLCISECLLHYS